MEEKLSGEGAFLSQSPQRGYVPKLEVFKGFSRAVLLVDGEEPVGAKHNKVMNAATQILLETNV
ncbi:MAG: hypothetical protein ACUVXD_13205 [Thermodesulfobacteriota bacterium]